MGAVKRRGPKRRPQLGERTQAASAKLLAQGLALPMRPDGEVPGLPDNLADVVDHELMRLFADLTTWAEFLGTQLAAATVDERSAAEQEEWARSTAAVRHRGEKTVAAQKALAADDEGVRQAQEAHMSAYAYRKLLESIYTGADRKAQVVSRELTRRVGRNDRESRRDKWNA